MEKHFVRTQGPQWTVVLEEGKREKIKRRRSKRRRRRKNVFAQLYTY
jgi:hypothetical protein